MGFEGLGDLMRSRCLSQETQKPRHYDSQAPPRWSPMMAMLRETRHAQFLFKGSDDISGFINDFYKKGIDLKFTRQEHEGTVVT